jgi:hypothetical protein
MNSNPTTLNETTFFLSTFSPSSTTYSPTKFLMLITLYIVSFVLACWLASIMNKTSKTKRILHHQRSHSGLSRHK